MDTHRTRPTGNRPLAGRPPNRGHPVPRPKKTAPTDLPALRRRVKKAADRLDEHGDTALASAVREYLTVSTKRTPAKHPVLPMYLRAATWQAGQADAAATGQTMEEIVSVGLVEFCAGRFVPVRPSRGSGEGKGTFTTRVSTELRAAVASYAAEHADDLGFLSTARQGANPVAQVAAAWLEHQYGTPVT